MAYRALYRQWRPQDFSHVVGQESVISTLRNQVITERIAHAYLFCGSRGTGKTSTAKILAKAINCENPQNGDPCGQCENCRRVEEEESLDIIEIDAASNNGVDEMRNLRDTVKYPPQYGKYKVYIIDEVHMLSTSAFNALLKTLEEPPQHIVFILATTEPQKLPATILSRCQRYDFGRIPAVKICSRLAEATEKAGAKATPKALMLIARAAEGGMRDALSILDMCIGTGQQIDEELVRRILGISSQSVLFQFSDALADGNVPLLFGMISDIIRQGKDPILFSKDISRHIRSLILAKCCPDDITGITEQTDEDVRDFVNQSERFTMTRLMRILDLFVALEADMKYSSTPRLALESTVLKCCLKTSEDDPSAMTERIETLEMQLQQMKKQIQDGILTVRKPEKEPKIEKQASGLSPDSEPSVKKRETLLEPSTSQSTDEQWKMALELMRKKEPAIAVMLTQHGHFSRKEGDLFIWEANDSIQGKIFVDSLNSPLRKEKILESLREITGRDCEFSAVLKEDVLAGTSDAGQSYIDSLVQTFGKENVQTVDSLE